MSIVGEHARPRDDSHLHRAGPFQRARACICSCPRRVDIVDEQDMRRIDPAPCLESRVHRFPALCRVQPAKDRRRPGADEHFAKNGLPRPCGNGPGQGKRLIEPARPQPPAVERDGHEHGIAVQPRGDERGHRPGDARALPIFQRHHDAPRDIAISNGGDHPVVQRGRGEAGSAQAPGGAVEREVAGSAARPGQEIQLLPAADAEPVIGIDDRTASGTARRQSEIDERTGEPDEHPLLSRARRGGTSVPVTAPAIFDRHARRLRRDATAAGDEPFFTGLMIDEILDRIDMMTRSFTDVLLVGAEPRLISALEARGMSVTVTDPAPARAALSGGMSAEEDDGSLAVAAFDLVLGLGTLETVDDLPGALALMRRALRPDGAFLAVFPGAGSLPRLRAAVASVDLRAGHAVARFHPQIDVRAAGDLLVRAGFALPVADLARFNLSYMTLDALLADLRAATMRNTLAERHGVTKEWRALLAEAFMQGADNGRVAEMMAFLLLTGWAPAPGQPRPAARGSATASLASGLREARQQGD